MPITRIMAAAAAVLGALLPAVAAAEIDDRINAFKQLFRKCSDIAVYLETGELPDSDYAGGAMAEVIDNGLAFLTQSDLVALVEFIAALKPLPSTRDR